MASRDKDRHPRPGPWRARIIVFFLGLSPFILLELVLRFMGYGEAAYPGFEPSARHFERSGQQWRLQERYCPAFHTRSFAVNKPKGTKRIFAVGDSVTWGWTGGSPKRRISPTYPEHLQQLLAKELSGAAVEVLNVGGAGHSSNRLWQVVQEVVEYEPDLVVVNLGHSEFIEYRYQAQWQRMISAGLPTWLSSWRTQRLARDLLRQAKATDHIKPRQEKKHRDRIQAGWELPVINEDQAQGADEIQRLLARTRENLRAMAESCQRAGIPLLLSTQAANLRVQPSALWRHPAWMEADGHLNIHLAEAAGPAEKLLEQGEARGALKLLLPAIAEISQDPQSRRDWRLSLLHYLEGRSYDVLKDHVKARAAYKRSKDLAPMPHRVLGQLNALVRDLAASHPVVYLADLERAFEEAMPDGIPDKRILVDHCHPDETGHRLMARGLLKAIQAHRLLR